MTKSIIFYVLLLTIFAIVAAQRPTTTDTKGTTTTDTKGTTTTGTKGTTTTGTKDTTTTGTTGTKPTCANSKITCPGGYELATSRSCDICSILHCCDRKMQKKQRNPRKNRH